MPACVNCSRTLQPAWKYCIFCGTRTGVAATAPRSRPLPKRMPVPGIASVATAQTPIVPPGAPAPLSAAPTEDPVSSIWPETMGERPSLRAALVGTEVPAPTPPREEAPAPEGEAEPAPLEDDVVLEGEAVAEPEAEPAVEPEPVAEAESESDPEPEPEPEAEAEPDAEPEPEPAPTPEATDATPAPEPEPLRRRSRRASAPAGTLVAEPLAAETELAARPSRASGLDLAADDEDEPTRAGSVNTLAILALLIGVLACPLAALFGHLALGQVRASGERGVIPAWIAIVLGYLWLGFWIVFGIAYLATNG